MAETIQLTKPKFIKIAEIKPGVHGYNAFVKVIKLDKQEVIKSNGEKLQVVDVTLGDDSSMINGHFVGKYCELLEEGKVFAIRNGKSTVFKEHQRLELDGFGKITKEVEQLQNQFWYQETKIDKVNNNKNLSDIAYEKIVKKVDDHYQK